MRPSDAADESALHECVDCGQRVRDPTGRTCEDCGGELVHIGRSRDV